VAEDEDASHLFGVIFQDSDKSCSWIQEEKRTAIKENDVKQNLLFVHQPFFSEKKSLSDIEFLEVFGVSLSNPLERTTKQLAVPAAGPDC